MCKNAIKHRKYEEKEQEKHRVDFPGDSNVCCAVAVISQKELYTMILRLYDTISVFTKQKFL